MERPSEKASHAATRPDVSSKIYDLDTGYQWGDRDWFTFRAKNPPYRRPMNIYECHLGSWRRTGEGEFLSYRDLASYLVPYVKEIVGNGVRTEALPGVGGAALRKGLKFQKKVGSGEIFLIFRHNYHLVEIFCKLLSAISNKGLQKG